MEYTNKSRAVGRVGAALGRYFPAFMLILTAMVLVCAAAYTFVWISPVFVAFCIVMAFMSLFAGLWQAHVLHEGSGQSTASLPDPADMGGILGEAGKNFNLASLSSVMREGMVLLKDGRILYANSAFAYILAMQESELAGSPLSSYMHPEDRAVLHLDGKAESSGSSVFSRGTLRLATRLGDVRWVICSVYCLIWRKEEIKLLLFEDIGALKQAQSMLEEHEQQSRILFERTPLGVAMFDTMGVLKLSNTDWRATWSNVAESGGRRFNILQDPFMPGTSVEREARKAFNKQESGINNYEHNTPWGETRWLNINFHPMLTPLGKLIGVAMIQQDITDYIRSTRRENELNEQLASLRMDLPYGAEHAFPHKAHSAPDVSTVSAASILRCLEECFRALSPDSECAFDYTGAELELKSNAGAMGKALAELSMLLLDLVPAGKKTRMSFFLRNETDFAGIHMFCEDADFTFLPLESFWHTDEGAGGGDFYMNGASPGEGMRKRRKSARDIAELGGMTGLYPGPDGGAGIVCRLPLPAQRLI